MEREAVVTEVMRTPMPLVWDQVLMLPIVGLLDSERTQRILELALNGIQEHRAKVLIVDVMGVMVIDEAVASHILKIAAAARLMGCLCILTGVSPHNARTMVELGIDLGNIHTHSTLRDGLEAALAHLGLKVVAKNEG